MKKVILAALLLSIPSVIYAQTTQTCPSDCRFNRGAVVSLSWQSDPTPSADGQKSATTAYRMVIDKVQIGADIPVSALVSGTVTIPSITLPTADGTHTFEVIAINSDLGTSTTSKSLTFTVGPPMPKAPTNLKITGVLTIALGEDGLWHFTLSLADQQ